jgi:two-component system chemotaxis family response regulator WspR
MGFNQYRMMVLLVDDQPIIGEAIRRLLSQEVDIGLHYCSEPLRALEEANRTKPTVILQDLVMPDIDGIELVRRYRSNPETTDIPIIVLSTREDPQVKGDAFAAGANDYLVKLPNKIELIARLRYHSRAYLNQLQRDEAYRALRESQQQLLETNTALLALNRELEEANRTISELARRDALTGLSNRRVVDEELRREAHRANRRAFDLTAIMADLDHFKSVNDTYGHGMGDEVLRQVGKTLQAEMRPYDLAARYGGEEFVVLLPETTLEQGRCYAERIREAIGNMQVPGYSGQITASLGVATLVPGQAPENLLPRADLAMYRAKQNGRNRVEVDETASLARVNEEISHPAQ